MKRSLEYDNQTDSLFSLAALFILMNSISFVDALEKAIGSAQVWKHPEHSELMSHHETDQRKKRQHKALAIAFPNSTAQVQSIVHLCHHYGIALIPQGGNTGLVGASTPDTHQQALIINSKNLNRIIDINSDDWTLTAQAGCTLSRLQSAALEKELYFPLSMASEGSCTIGGNLAVNAGGTQVLRFGSTRHLCLGLEAVLPNGALLNTLHSLRKNNTGYALSDLLIGSEGTLGFITQATLRLYAQPFVTHTAWIAVHDFQTVLELFYQARSFFGDSLTAFEMMNPLSLELVKEHLEFIQWPFACSSQHWHILIELSDSRHSASESPFEAFYTQLHLASDLEQMIVAQSLSHAEQFWKIRESIPLAQSASGSNIKHDISLPLSQMKAFIESTEALLKQAIKGIRIVNFGHLGDGNLHFNIQAPIDMSAGRFIEEYEEKIQALVFDQVQQHQGSISAEHGIGRFKTQALKKYQDPTALLMMKKIKEALDPQRLFNPGVLFSEEDDEMTPADPATIRR